MVKATVKRSKKIPIKTCCICIDSIDRRHEARITSCRHRYHYKCIKKWSHRDNTCPQCRRHFNWIIRIKNNRKERVPMSCDIANLLYCFFNEIEFREFLLIGIYERSTIAIKIFKIIREIVTFMRRVNQYPATLDERSRVEACTWLDTMSQHEEITVVDTV
jgi:hypothetical protein